MIVAPVRVVQGASAILTFQSVDADGEPTTTDPGTVTVGVVRADGTVVAAPGQATTGTAGSRSYTLPATATALLDRLTVTWTASGVAIATTPVDVVGNVYATTADIRNAQMSLGDSIDYPTATLIQARGEVETMVERACGAALSFVPRFDTATMFHDGQKMLKLPHYFLRRIRWAKYWYTTSTSTDVTAGLLTGIQPNEAGLAILYDASYSWPTGRLVVGYEHGLDAPPPDLKRAAIIAVRRNSNQSRSAIDPRAMSYTMANGEVQRFATPALGPWVTGIPEVDEVLKWWRDRYPTAAAVT